MRPLQSTGLSVLSNIALAGERQKQRADVAGQRQLVWLCAGDHRQVEREMDRMRLRVNLLDDSDHISPGGAARACDAK